MKKILFALLISFCLAGQVKAETNLNTERNMTKETTVNDYQKVKNALNAYLEAGRQGKSSVLKPFVYKDAIIYSAADGKVDGGSISALFEYLDNNPPATDLEADISSVEIAGNIAYAKVESNNWHGARYTDLFLLVKDGDTWKILTKTFHTHK